MTAPSLGEPAAEAQRESSFGALERLLEGRSTEPLVVVVAPRGALQALGDHVERRLEGRGATVLRTISGVGGEGFRNAVQRLRAGAPFLRGPRRLDAAPVDPPSAREVAAELLSAVERTHVAARPACVVVVDPECSRFSRAVAAEIDAHGELAEASAFPRVVWVTDAAPPGHRRAVVLDEELTDDDVEAWWRSAASSVAPKQRSLKELDDWWRAARLAQPAAAAGATGAPRSGAAAELLGALHAAGRPWPEARLGDLLPDEERAGARALLAALAAGGLVDATAEGVIPAPGVVAAASDPCARRVATALARVFPDDPWALFRAAELRFQAADPTDADLAEGDVLAQRAIADVVDGEARGDFWSRLVACSPSLDGGIGGPAGAAASARMLRYVELASFTGDVDMALRYARAAATADPQSSEARLALGKCYTAMGDTPAALVTMEKATELAESSMARARVFVELAEVRYRSGELAAAETAVADALALIDAEPPAPGGRPAPAAMQVRLDARNVSGKVLLAQAAFAEAELHFTADSCEAALAQQLVAELRARVNRAIAVLYLGRRPEARALLEAVLADAERRGEAVRAGHALLNLAVIATLDHRYADALEITERASKAVLRAGERPVFARCSANLADLRLRLGMLNEAEQAIRFGARVLRGALPGYQVAQFTITQARVHLARGSTALAQQSIMQALSEVGATVVRPSGTRPSGGDASRGPGREVVSQALRVAARVALEDGDTAQARVLIDQAAAEGGPARALADVAVLRGLLARALGEGFGELAGAALDAARDADDIELLREAHTLLFFAAWDEGDYVRARHHLSSAASYRDRVLVGLPEGLRPAFLARRDLVALALEARAFEAAEAAVRPAHLGEARASQPVARGGVALAPSFGAVAAGASALGERPRLVGDDPAVRALHVAVRKVGAADTTVLVYGESGTGKELVAEAHQEASARRGGPLVKVNCAALVETLLLSELFGHEKGSFTGAAARRRGRFEAAEGGTLFLDEIGDISPRTQVALLRVLQEKTFERVGGTTPIRANVRVVCATHRNLKQLVARGEFREDLYYRLCGVVLEVPALRARLGDLGAIAAALLARIAAERGGPVKTLSPRALGALKSHAWPGNVRELENALRAASLFAEGTCLEPEDFSENVEGLRGLCVTPVDTQRSEPARRSSVPVAAISYDPASPAEDCAEGALEEPGTWVAASDGVAARSSIPAPTPSDAAYAQVRSGTSLHDMKRIIERECIARALADAGGNITRAAALLGMKRPRLSQLVKQYGLGGGATDSDCDDEGLESEEDA